MSDSNRSTDFEFEPDILPVGEFVWIEGVRYRHLGDGEMVKDQPSVETTDE